MRNFRTELERMFPKPLCDHQNGLPAIRIFQRSLFMKPRHFLSLFDLAPAELQYVLRRADELKTQHRRGERYAPFPQKVLGMIFEKASTRTR
ncbi:MAG TPA: hypothetical protein PK018_15045, partial [Candidatus Competibacter sp.]|nr:hypothetical protein [Candidatus Competibacter sp.]